MLIFPLILLGIHLRAAGTPLDFIFIFELMTTIGAPTSSAVLLLPRLPAAATVV